MHLTNGPKRKAFVRIPPPLPPSIFFGPFPFQGGYVQFSKGYLDGFLFMCPPVSHSLGEFGSASLRDSGCCYWNIFQATSEPIQKKRRQSLITSDIAKINKRG